MPAPNTKILSLTRLSENQLNIIKDVNPYIEVIIKSKDEVLEYIDDADILLVKDSYPQEILNRKNLRLKWIHFLSHRADDVFFSGPNDELSDFGTKLSDIIITNSKGSGEVPISEHVMAMILGLSRGLNFFARAQQNHNWERNEIILEEICNKTLVLLGLGYVNRVIAKKAKAFGMHVTAVTNTITNTELFIDHVFRLDRKSCLRAVAEGDFVLSNFNLTKSTRRIIDREIFEAMRPTAYFISIASGEIVVEEDLIKALQDKKIKGAALDVFEDMPLSKDSPLWDMPNVIITPDVAAFSPAYKDRAIKFFVENLILFLEKQPLFNVINHLDHL
ncbi:D-2-hydroxyacid dehydrogenase [Selenomonadales bacterium OttesenSCG-928-I06]|nr:D-2-hydroxyacid dehydrogenase [Selenomonadales bacterium OttesenSCG-928-I06]